MGDAALSQLMRAVTRLTGVKEPGVGDFIVGQDQVTKIDDDLEKGKEVKLADVTVNNGLLSYKGRQVLLYIPDHGRRISAVLDESPTKGNKFHIADCTALEMMREKQRFERYIATNDLSGDFTVVGITETGGNRRGTANLQVCKYCLQKINFKDARKSKSHRAKVCNEFSISGFFETYSTFFPHMPKDRFVKEGYGAYPDNWAEISEHARRLANWTCQGCQINLSEHRKLLHTHHMDGLKHNNKPSNLKVLCIDCHRRQPNHGSIVIRPNEMEIITRLRNLLNGGRVSWTEAFDRVDLALHGALYVAQKAGWSAPEVGKPFSDASGRVVHSGAAWPDRKTAVFVEGSHVDVPAGWQFSGPQALIDRLG